MYTESRMQNAFLESEVTKGTMAVGLKNDWVFGNVRSLGQALDDVDAGNADHVTFQCGGLKNIDIAGAWVLFREANEKRLQVNSAYDSLCILRRSDVENCRAQQHAARQASKVGNQCQ